jgi:hypothetical protein
MKRSSAPLALALLCAACSEPLSAAECETLLDRYVSLLVASDRPNTSDAELVRLKALARDKAQRDPAFLRCSREVSRSQFQCAMKAENVDRLEQCLL